MSRRKYTTAPWEEKKKAAFKIYSLKDTTKAVYDSDDLEVQYISKLVCWRESESEYRFYFYSTKHRNVLKVDLRKENKGREQIVTTRNGNDYHEDWPFELREMKLTVGGQERVVNFFMVLNEFPAVEVVNPCLKGRELRRVEMQIRD